jgi:SAM-dependent methyltransferase
VTESLARGDSTGWFERLYAAADEGEMPVPWDRGMPHPLLVQWGQAREFSSSGHRALIIGCGLGEDAEYIAGLGFDTVAFDIAASAIQAARRRFPDSHVQYINADLLNPPAQWYAAFDLVVESLTVQALPDPPRREAIAAVGRMVAPGGTLIVIAAAREDQQAPEQGPPWPLTRTEIESFTTSDLLPVRIEFLHDASSPTVRRWRAEFHRQDG